ncbi:MULTISPECIES: DUF1707 domain-containing protein [unclassified Actinopolyspora]|uniref:DUF1707 domain-containing protein n=1 Tax=unclassified Actinopolyspora TaxID=2639451 RepID=UPI0013F627F5|nr:DUF1707 domain-containing protein [Actinopolyspora sp. BKK2]NHE78159.1 DUF1707 domain-containing protein [Actinopolyspora sp. BKK1]
MAGQGSRIRIGDRDRDRAVALLGEHFSAGRLEIDEFDERCRRATAALYRADVAALFSDLPEPHPEVLAAPVEVGSRGTGERVPRRVRASVVGISVVVALVALLVVTKQVWIVLPMFGFWFAWFATRK